MTIKTRIFENEYTFEVSAKAETIEFSVYDQNVNIDCSLEDGWESQRTNFVLTREEATALKIFLEKQGF